MPPYIDSEPQAPIIYILVQKNQHNHIHSLSPMFHFRNATSDFIFRIIEMYPSKPFHPSEINNVPSI